MDANPVCRYGAIACATLAVSLALPTSLHAAGQVMFPSVADCSAEKPQSKLFYHDGAWWCVLQGNSGVAFHRLSGGTWQQGTFPGAVLQSTGQADVKWNGTNLFVLVYSSTTRLYKYSYDAPARAWILLSGFPVNLLKPSSTETMVLEQDSSGRLWTTTEGSGSIYVYYSTSADHRTWSTTPVIVATGVDGDDISSVVAFGGDQIGVFWSDQRRMQFGFRVHRDVDPPGTWATTEIAYSGSGQADDHVHLAVDASGRVYAVTKNNSDRVQVHRRSTSGAWTTKTDVAAGNATRPIIMIADADAKAYILYTRWGVSPYRIEYRVANLETLVFGGEATFINSSSAMNNASGTKQPLPAGTLIAIAENGSNAWWNGFGALGGGDTPPPPPPDAPINLAASLVLPGPVVTGSIVHLSLDDAGAQSATDASGNGNDARLGSTTGADAGDPAWIAGVSGSALEFGGSDFLEVADAPSLDPGGSFTIEAWVRRNSGGGIIVNKGGATRTYRVVLNSSGRADFRWHPTIGTEHRLSMSGSLSDHVWHHIACVYDQGAGQNRIYVDGILNASGPASGIPALNDKLLTIGAREPGETEFLRGALDDLQISSGVKYTGDFTPTVAGRGDAIVAASASDGAAAALSASDGMPAVLAAFPAGSSIAVQWNPPSGGATVAGYRVYRSVNAGGYALMNASLITGTRYTDQNLADGQLCYRAAAVGLQSLEGPPSNTACVTAPAAPTIAQGPIDDAAETPGVATTVAGGLAFTASVHPNPSHGEGALEYTLSRAEAVRVALFDLAGRRVRTLLDSPNVAAGHHTLSLDQRSGRGSRLPAGVYLYRIEAAEGVRTGRFVVLD